MIDEILNIIFPNVCGFCGKIEKNCLCKDCERRISLKANYEMENNHIFLLHYEDEIREKILSYKFERKIIYV